MGHKSELINALDQRGYIQDATDLAALDTKAAEGTITAYVGFDLTASSLHVGNLVSIMLLRRLQQAGHRPIVLMGGGTTKVGDPSGKDASRKLLTSEQIDENKANILKAFKQFLKFGDGPTDAIMIDNSDWLDHLEYISFLRDIGRHFSINRMLTMDSVKLRLEREQPLSFLEFNYMILQAYDFLELNRRFDCTLQMGGSDQWGNIVNGVDLTRRVAGNTVYGLTTPLITTADGAKMGKTAKGAVWLNEEALPAYDYWQFWRNTQDADVGRFLRIFTDLPLDEITRLEALEGQEINEAKKILATEATAMCRGREAAEAAADTAQKTFEQGISGAALPQISVDKARLNSGLSIIEALVDAGLVASKGEARRLIRGGGAKVNDVKIIDENQMLQADDFNGDGKIKLSAGKKKHALIVKA
ncbi:MAG: tyrosine--tRNA ligase [Sphingomonadales bacterium]